MVEGIREEWRGMCRWNCVTRAKPITLAGMLHCLRQLPIRLRHAVLLLCALMLVVQPVFTAAGELHELAHDPSGRHASLLTPDAPSADSAVDGASTGAATDVLHVLVEGAHCCGPGAAMAPLLHFIALTPEADRLAGAVPPPVPDTRLPAPFKPPRFD